MVLLYFSSQLHMYVSPMPPAAVTEFSKWSATSGTKPRLSLHALFFLCWNLHWMQMILGWRQLVNHLRIIRSTVMAILVWSSFFSWAVFNFFRPLKKIYVPHKDITSPPLYLACIFACLVWLLQQFHNSLGGFGLRLVFGVICLLVQI